MPAAPSLRATAIAPDANLPIHVGIGASERPLGCFDAPSAYASRDTGNGFWQTVDKIRIRRLNCRHSGTP
jgi:hypothetical protein